jgi:hypothetical protein
MPPIRQLGHGDLDPALPRLVRAGVHEAGAAYAGHAAIKGRDAAARGTIKDRIG